MSHYNGFVPIPLVIDLEPSSSSSSSVPGPAPHYIWIKQHRPPKVPQVPSTIHGSASAQAAAAQALRASLATLEATYPADRTLFVANLPVDYDVREDTQRIFGEYGPIERVVVKENKPETDRLGAVGDWEQDSESESENDESEDEEEQQQAQPVATSAAPETRKLSRRERQRAEREARRSQIPTITPLPSLEPRATPLLPTNSSCYVVFLDALALKRAVSLASSRKIKLTRGTSSLGLAYFRSTYDALRPSITALQAHADSCLALYDHHLKAQQQRTSQEAIVDEDGFTLVVRGGRFGRTAGKGDKGVAVASRRFVMESGRKVRELQKGGATSVDVDAREGLQRGKKRKGTGAEAIDGFYSFQRNEKRRQGESIRACPVCSFANVIILTCRPRTTPCIFRGGQGKSRKAQGAEAIPSVLIHFQALEGATGNCQPRGRRKTAVV